MPHQPQPDATPFSDGVDLFRETSNAEVPIFEQQYAAMFHRVSASAIASLIGTSASYVKNHAHKLGYETALTDLAPSNPIRGYEKQVVLELKLLLDTIPIQGSWLSLLNLQERTGIDRATSKKILAEKGVDSESRRSNVNRVEGQFYPPESEMIVNDFRENRAKPAGDWKTDSGIAAMLGREHGWVTIRTMPYRTVSEERIAIGGNEETHYSPEVQAVLKIESDALDALPFATSEDIALRSLSLSVKHGDAWVLERIPYTSSAIATKRNLNNRRTYTYVCPDPHDDLADMPKDILTMKPVDYLNQRSDWIVAELDKLNVYNSTLRMTAKRLKEGVVAERQRRELERKKVLDQEALRQLPRATLDKKPPQTIQMTNSAQWRNDAACIQDGVDPEIFSPEKGQSMRPAKKICELCGVKVECLDYALEKNENFGVWGGLGANERRKLRQKMQKPHTPYGMA